MRYAALAFALGIFLISAPAHAQETCCPGNLCAVARQTCDYFGKTQLSSDCTDILACLYGDQTQTAALVWKATAAGNWIKTGTSLGCTTNVTAPTGSCAVGATTTSLAGYSVVSGLCLPGQIFGQIHQWTCE